MAKFPVEGSDQDGIIEAINNLLSGPSGLGQNFAGFSNYEPAYLTGNFRVPYTVQTYYRDAKGNINETTITVNDATSLMVGMQVSGTGIGTDAKISAIDGTSITLTVANTAEVYNRVWFQPATIPSLTVLPIELSVSEMLDGRTWKFNFETEQTTPPFQLGNGISVSGVLDPYYDGGYTIIGVVECTTTYVIARTDVSYNVVAPSSGGTVELTTGTASISTDCNARVTVTGGNDRVFISGQLSNAIDYEVYSDAATIKYTVQINRYYGFPNNDPVNPDFVFGFSGTVAEKIYTYSGLTGTGTLPEQETIFASSLDIPNIGYYWYILEVSFETVSGSAAVTSNELGLRSISVQVVKE